MQQARGVLAGTLDSVAKARVLARRIGALGKIPVAAQHQQQGGAADQVFAAGPALNGGERRGTHAGFLGL